jgi:hypothetical protein
MTRLQPSSSFPTDDTNTSSCSHPTSDIAQSHIGSCEACLRSLLSISTLFAPHSEASLRSLALCRTFSKRNTICQRLVSLSYTNAVGDTNIEYSAVISLIGGLIFSPHAANLIRPLDYAQGNAEDLETITLYFTRLVLGVQLVLAGVQLPSKYLKQEWRPLSLLLVCCLQFLTR